MPILSCANVNRRPIRYIFMPTRKGIWYNVNMALKAATWGGFRKSYPSKFRNIRRKTPLLKSLFKKKRLQPGCFLVNIVKLLKHLFSGTSARSSHRRCSVGKDVLRNFAKFTGKHLCQSLFFNKVVDLRPATLLKTRLWHRCFPVNVAKFLRRPFLQNTSRRLLLICERCFCTLWLHELWNLFSVIRCCILNILRKHTG